MNRHRTHISEFDGLVDAYRPGQTTRDAYEMAENDWVMIHGVRRYRSYKIWYASFQKRKRLKPRLARPETLRFIEIYQAVCSPYRDLNDNYELAEDEYQKRYGRRRFRSYNSFYVAQAKILKKQKQTA